MIARPHPPDGWARLRFEDDGEGTTKRTLNRIFEPFFSTKPRDEETGVGMALSWRATGFIDDMPFEVSRRDPVSLVGIALLVGAASTPPYWGIQSHAKGDA